MRERKDNWRWVAWLGMALVAFALAAPDANAAQKRRTSKAAPAAAKAKPAAKAATRGAIRKTAYEPERQSLGQQQGLHATDDPLELKSSVALVIDQDTEIGRAHV